MSRQAGGKEIQERDKKMELLIIRTCDNYLRFKEDRILEVGLDKASVFPMDRLSHVKDLERRATAQGFEKTRIRKLILQETDL